MISVVVPFFNEAENIGILYDRVRSVLDGTGELWEMICVNDGSSDNTLKKLVTLHQEDSRIYVIDLTRNFGKEAALTAGMDHAQGDAVIPLDADLQDPPEVIPDMISKWREGYDVVNAVRVLREGESWFKRLSSYIFYRVINKLSPVEIPLDVGDFRLVSKSVLEALKQLPERRRFMKGVFAWVGFRTASIPYYRDSRFLGKTKWNYWKLWNLAMEGITSFSQIPLQLASYIGFFVSISSFAYAMFFLVRTLIYGNPVKGYPSLIVIVLFLGGVQLMALGVIGEYLGRTYEETKQRPIYLVRQKWSGPA
jgi:glycosyltransferase involved in cell wall biosynthesis